MPSLREKWLMTLSAIYDSLRGSAGGLEDGAYNTVPVAERLRMPKLRNAAWDDLAYQFKLKR
ncbi:hypothetical protein ACG7TL_001906 [Trametes sanguinea]